MSGSETLSRACLAEELIHGSVKGWEGEAQALRMLPHEQGLKVLVGLVV